MRRLLSSFLRCRITTRTTLRHLSDVRGPILFSSTSIKRPIKTSCAKKHDVSFKIVKDISSCSKFDADILAGSNIELDDLEISLNGETLSLNLTWLRDSCHCHLCTHKHSRQRLFTPKDFSKRRFEVSDIGMRYDSATRQSFGPSSSVRSNEVDDLLYIKWADDHESRYSMSWLSSINNLYRSSRLDSSPRRPTFDLPTDGFYASNIGKLSTQEEWNVSKLETSMKPVDYHDLVDGFEFHDDEPTFINANNMKAMSNRRYESLISLTGQLTKFGLAKIVNVPEQKNQVLNVARSMAYERPTGYGTLFDVVVEPSEEINLAYSSQEFDLHSDLTYRETSPGVQLLHCIKNSDAGGVSYFSDTLKAVNELRQADQQLFEVLLQFPAVFVVRDPYRDICFRRQKPILSLDYGGKLEDVYYSPFMLPPIGFKDDVKCFYLALDKFTQILQSQENKLKTKMEPGDLFIFHNRRVLHGRSSYDPTKGNRFLQGCYMDWDEITCLFEKLVSHNKVIHCV